MDYPEVPPGVKMFDPRRIRRYRKAMGLAAEKDRLAQEVRITEAEKRAVLRDLAQERRRADALTRELASSKREVMKALADARAPRPGILKRVMGLFRRRP